MSKPIDSSVLGFWVPWSIVIYRITTGFLQSILIFPSRFTWRSNEGAESKIKRAKVVTVLIHLENVKLSWLFHNNPLLKADDKYIYWNMSKISAGEILPYPPLSGRLRSKTAMDKGGGGRK